MERAPTWRGTTAVASPTNSGTRKPKTATSPWNVYTCPNVSSSSSEKPLSMRSTPRIPPTTEPTTRKRMAVAIQRLPTRLWSTVVSQPARPRCSTRGEGAAESSTSASGLDAGRVSVTDMAAGDLTGGSVCALEPGAQELVERHRPEEQRDVRDREAEQSHGPLRGGGPEELHGVP